VSLARRPRAVHGHRARVQGVLDHRAGQDRPDPLVEACRSPGSDRGGGRHHEVQAAQAPDGAQAGGGPAEPAACERHRPRGGEAAREPQAAGRQGAPLPRAARRDAGHRAGGVWRALPDAARAGSLAGRSPRRGGGARAGGLDRTADRRGADGDAPRRSLRGRRPARGRTRSTVGPDARRRSPPEQERLLPGTDQPDPGPGPGGSGRSGRVGEPAGATRGQPGEPA